MKLELGPDLQALRIRARQRIAAEAEELMPMPAQSAVYQVKYVAATRLVSDEKNLLCRIGLRKRRVPELIVAEATRRGVEPIDLAKHIVEQAESDQRLREQIELHRVDFVMRLQEATSERDIQALEAEMMTKLAALGAST